jgi:pimeloyl-ACP methyl ester carboxylesterase
MVQAPNTYPQWLAPKAPVTLEFSDKILTTFTNHFLHVASPEARIRYRIVKPANYDFRWTNHLDEANGQLQLSFTARVDRLNERTNHWTADPRGTVILLHGYGVSGFAMLPWALLLGKEGWRCVLVDLRGHGKSTGKQIYFGTQEVSDLRALLDELQARHGVNAPVSVVGHSYGAVLALRWKMLDPRVSQVVAMSPYADLSKAILSVSEQYASWLPKSFLKAGLRKLPELLHVSPCELNPECWVEESNTLFIAGEQDKIAPLHQVQRLYETAGPGNKMLVIPRAAHEPLPFYFDALADPITRWLGGERLTEASGRDGDDGSIH